MNDIKTLKLALIKKNRVWIDCKHENGYNCKLKLNEYSKNLELGANELTVKDISVRSKYGVELRYEMFDEKMDEKIFLTHFKYNGHLVERCKDMGGKWDSEGKCWVFSAVMRDKVEALDEKYNGETCFVEITALRDIFRETPTFLGYTVARATGRDSGARLGEEVYQLSGEISSGGSLKNWYTSILQGSKFRLEVPINLLKNYESHMWEYKILDNQ